MEDYPDYETIEYHLIYSELIQAARRRGTVTYQELARVVGLPLSGNYMGKRIGELLGTVVFNEFNQGRPMLSALAVNTEGKPGSGFIPWAEKVGYLQAGDDPTQFWETQRKACYDTWQQTFQKP
jgi:hypothetical protein